MSAECETCGEHTLYCKCKMLNLEKLTTKLIIDYHQWRERILIMDDQVSIADIKNYCRAWLKENLKDENVS